MRTSLPLDHNAILERARALVTAGDLGAALEPMLEVWRAIPDTELADAIVALGARAAGTYASIASTSDERDLAWLRLANAGDPATRTYLLATVTEGDLVVRFTALLAFPDPRTTARLVDLLITAEPAPHLSWAAKWRPLMAALVKCRDPRTVDRVVAIADAWTDRLHVHGAAGRNCRASVEKLLAKVRAAYSSPPPELPPAARAIIAAIATSALPETDDRETEAALRAAIYAAPADDGPRSVYADWLQERGDPRGEFIMLQLARGGREAGARDRDLAHLYGREWLGSLAPHVTTYMYITYARGFPSYLPLSTSAPPPDPAWATLEHVQGGFPASDACPMPVLATVSDVGADALLRLAAMTNPPPLEVLEVTDAGSKPRVQVLAALARLRLPKLRRLALRAPAWVATPAYAPSDLGALCAIGPLEELELSGPIEQLAAWLIAARATALASFTLVVDDRHPTWAVRCERDKSALLSRIVVRGSKRDAEGGRIQLIAAALEQLPENTITALAIETSPRVWTAPLRRDVARALDRHRGLEATLPGFTRPR